MEREIIEIDEELCIGCGNCVPNCHQGALQIIDGKARLISDLMCEGLGACVGHCPTGAMTISRREAEPYDEAQVMEKIISQGPNVIRAHLDHLVQHSQHTYLAQAKKILSERGITVEPTKPSNELHQQTAPENNHADQNKPHQHNHHNHHNHHGGGCPGSMARSFAPAAGGSTGPFTPGIDSPSAQPSAQPSALRQWPVQLHLLNPAAQYFQRADVLLAADCSAYAAGNFHRDFLAGKTLAIACPKLDRNLESYIVKITAMIDESKINTLTVLIMEVPCCGGLLQIARTAVEQASRKIPLKLLVMGLEGEILQEEWV